MIATLVIPSADGVTQVHPLHLDFVRGEHVLLASNGHIINGSYFQFLRDRFGARIETNEPQFVAQVLRVPGDDPGFVAAG